MVLTFTATCGIDSSILIETQDSCKIDIDVRYFSYLKDVIKKEYLVVPMQVYDLILDLL